MAKNEAAKSYVEIGRVLGISGQRVQQIEAQALKKLRENPLVQKLLKEIFEELDKSRNGTEYIRA